MQVRQSVKSTASEDTWSVVQRQTSAYNQRDLEAFCALFSPLARMQICSGEGSHVLSSPSEIQNHFSARFDAPDLHCEVRGKLVMGDLAVVHERVAGIGEAPVDVIAAYKVVNGAIEALRIVWPEGSMFDGVVYGLVGR